jgi:hypothetical protein
LISYLTNYPCYRRGIIAKYSKIIESIFTNWHSCSHYGVMSK